MLYSKTFCLRPLPQLPIALAALLLICQFGTVQANEQSRELIGSNLGMPSSEPNNGLIDNDTIAPSAPQLSPAEAAELVRKKVGGQVMSVTTQHAKSGVVYGVKVLNAGRMRVINVDGQTGRLLNH